MPEANEPAVSLAGMPEGRKVVEDYRTVGLSLRHHPVAFLRGELSRMGMATCGSLPSMRSGQRVTAAGLVLVRQKPGSAKGTMFITIEDETGVGNVILWPKVFEAQRRLVLSAGMIACRGRVQSHDGVTHLIAEHLTDLTPMLNGVGRRDEVFPLPYSRGTGSPDNRGRRDTAIDRTHDIHPPNSRLGSTIKVPTRDFR